MERITDAGYSWQNKNRAADSIHRAALTSTPNNHFSLSYLSQSFRAPCRPPDGLALAGSLRQPQRV
jgi:hypothetical protein